MKKVPDGRELFIVTLHTQELLEPFFSPQIEVKPLSHCMLLLLGAKKVPKPGSVGLRNFQKTVDVLHHKLEIGWGQCEGEDFGYVTGPLFPSHIWPHHAANTAFYADPGPSGSGILQRSQLGHLGPDDEVHKFAHNVANKYADEEVNIIGDAGLGADEDSRFVEFYDTRVSSEMFQPYHSSDLEFSGMRRSIRPTATPGPARRGYGHRLCMASDVISYDNDGYSGREGRGSRGNRGGRGGGRGRGWNGERDRRNGFDDDHNNFRGGPAGGGPGGPYNNNNQGYDARGPGPGPYGVGGYYGGSGPGPGPGNYGAPTSGSASRAKSRQYRSFVGAIDGPPRASKMQAVRVILATWRTMTNARFTAPRGIEAPRGWCTSSGGAAASRAAPIMQSPYGAYGPPPPGAMAEPPYGSPPNPYGMPPPPPRPTTRAAAAAELSGLAPAHPRPAAADSTAAAAAAWSRQYAWQTVSSMGL
ncbi:hypothetical protein B0H14DRAFT_3138370 [Mycena olivaceomarginata]|nr:hypothetical protein B0H14DRAFT_3138370 [Mycena olivaceomarginata]